jgi:hypothetical protein
MSLKPVYDAIVDIASDSSRLSKEAKIKKYLDLPNFQKVVIYAYDYNKKYNVTNALFIEDHGYELELNTLFKYLAHLSTLNGASDEYKYNLSVLSSIDKETNIVVNRIINKDLKCGAGINTFSKFVKDLPVFEIMTCQKVISKFLKWNKGKPYYWSPKKDGTRVINYVFEDRVESHLSRNGLEYPNFGVFDKDLIKLANIIHNKYSIPYPVYIDGESISSDGTFNKVMTQIRRKTDVDVSTFKFHVFDLPCNLKFDERYSMLEEAFFYSIFDRLDLVPHQLCNFNEQELLELSAQVIETGVKGIDEGIVIKIADSSYEWKEHSKYWCKIKPTDTKDLEVTGFYFGKPGTKYENLVGGLIVDFEGVEVRVGSGLSDEQRVEFLDNLPSLIEVEFKEITKDGSLREPIMVRVRDDKSSIG